MNDDLISRKGLINKIENSMNFNPHEKSEIALNHRHEHVHFLNIAISMPTAYDVDAVCEELENQEKNQKKHGISMMKKACLGK